MSVGWLIELGRGGRLERWTFLPISLKRTLQNCQRANEEGDKGCQIHSKGSEQRVGGGGLLLRACRHGALLCSALQVTPMSHLHPTHHALHITPVSAPVLKWGLALVSTGEAWMG